MPLEHSISHDERGATPPGLLLVDDHELVRLGLQTLILSLTRNTGQSMHVFEASTLEEALRLYS